MKSKIELKRTFIISFSAFYQYVKCIAGKCSGGCTPNILTVHFNIPRSNA